MPNESVVNPGATRTFALNRSSRIFLRQYGGILAGLLAVIIIFTSLSSKFLSVNNMTNILLAIGNGDLFGIPNPILILIMLLVINHFVLSKTVFGRRIYFAGGNREAALYSGINVIKLKILVFIVMGDVLNKKRRS